MIFMHFAPIKKSVIQVEASSNGLGEGLLEEEKTIAFTSKGSAEMEQYIGH